MKILISLCIAGALTVSSTAWAQSTEPTDAEVAAGGGLLTTTTTGGLVTVAGAVILTVVLVSKKGKTALNTYIRHNAVALNQAITLGGGPVVADLAQIFSVPPSELSAFANSLRKRRGVLVRLVHGTATLGQTDEFIAVVHEVLVSELGLQVDESGRVAAG